MRPAAAFGRRQIRFFALTRTVRSPMIIIQIKDNETVDRALKRFKKKFEKTGVMRQLRSRSFFQKPSVTKKKQREKAVYRLQMQTQETV